MSLLQRIRWLERKRTRRQPFISFEAWQEANGASADPRTAFRYLVAHSQGRYSTYVDVVRTMWRATPPDALDEALMPALRMVVGQ